MLFHNEPHVGIFSSDFLNLYIDWKLGYNGREDRLGWMATSDMSRGFMSNISKQQGFIPHATNIDNTNRHASLVCSFHQAPRRESR